MIPRQGKQENACPVEKAEDCHCQNDIKNASIIILDEANCIYSDPENENKIQKSIEELTKGKTLLVIAHRLSTITYADKIVVLKNGCIEGAGNPGRVCFRNCQSFISDGRLMWEQDTGQ